ncbi:Calx-beta domain-containing protein [Chloroflexota bacterium]
MTKMKILLVSTLLLLWISGIIPHTWTSVNSAKAYGPFTDGDMVKVTDVLNVRTGPGTTDYVEISDADYAADNWCAPEGTGGIVLDGPEYADGYTWYQIDFGPGRYTGWASDHRLIEASLGVNITSYSPSSLTQVTVGDSINLSVAFSNTGDTSWCFIAGATVWDSDGSQIANYSETLSTPLQPTQETVVTLPPHTVSQGGDYWLQFGVWKTTPYVTENRLDREPSPSQKLITGTQSPTIEITSGPSGPIAYDDITFAWQGSDSDGTVNGYEYKIDGTGYSTASTSKTFNDLAEGDHTFEVRCYDDNGLYSSWATRDFTITEESGGISVTIEPSEARDAGAQWNVDGGTWQDSGATISDLSVGNHTVYFKDISGWSKPATIYNVPVSNGSTTYKTGTYTEESGSVSVTIEPSGARDDGAQWNVDGGTWQDSGVTVSDLSVGNHTVGFKDISEWAAPSSESVYINADQTTSITRSYTEQSSILVNLNVPFLQQADPPGEWENTNNCGQASAAMIFGYLNSVTPTSQDIMDIDDWLFQQYGDPINGYNGSPTNTTNLEALAISYGGFANSEKHSSWTIEDLESELSAGYPVIIAVRIGMGTDTGGHFMVIRGMDADNVYVNDPGRSLASGEGENKAYTISTFLASWATQGNACVTIREGGSGGNETVAFSSTNYAVGEGEGIAEITVNLSGVSASVITVDYTTSDDTATAGADYIVTSGTLTFTAGETSKTFTIVINDDTTVEGDETISLTLSNPTNIGLTASTAVLTISDNDKAPGNTILAQQTLSSDSPAIVQSDDEGISLYFPVNSVLNDAVVTLREEPNTSNPECPYGFKAGATCFTIDMTESLAPGAMVTITVKYCTADLEACGGKPDNLTLSRYDEEPGDWVILPTTVDKAVMTLTATTDKFSQWMVMVDMTPKIKNIAPDQGNQGDTLDITITGSSFEEATDISFSSGIIVNSFKVDSATQITANIKIANDAAPGFKNVSVTTPDGTGTLSSCFNVMGKGDESGSCSCGSASMNISAKELAIGWVVIGLCWGSGYCLMRKRSRHKRISKYN